MWRVSIVEGRKARQVIDGNGERQRCACGNQLEAIQLGRREGRAKGRQGKDENTPIGRE